MNIAPASWWYALYQPMAGSLKITNYMWLYVYIPLAVVGGIYWHYDHYILAARESKATLAGLDDFQTAQILLSSEGILAFNLESQRMAIIKRKTTKVLDISEVREATSHWTSLSKNGIMMEKDFHVLLTIADISEPEINVKFHSKYNTAVCLEIIRQMIERRVMINLQLETESKLPLIERGNSGFAVILTAVEIETRAALSHLDKIGETVVAGTLFCKGVFRGTKGDWVISVAEVGPRNVTAGLVAERAIQSFKPDVALFIGIAGGIKDVKPGDVVAATKIYAYDSGKETSTGFVPRPELRLTSHALEQRARSVGREAKWLGRLRETHRETPSAFVGPIAAGDVLIANSKSATAMRIKKYYSDAITAEMEGYGFLSALHLNPSTHGIVIRGISDLFDGKSQADAAGWQSLAADSTAAFAFEMLAEIDVHAGLVG